MGAWVCLGRGGDEVFGVGRWGGGGGLRPRQPGTRAKHTGWQKKGGKKEREGGGGRLALTVTRKYWASVRAAAAACLAPSAFFLASMAS